MRGPTGRAPSDVSEYHQTAHYGLGGRGHDHGRRVWLGVGLAGGSRLVNSSQARLLAAARTCQDHALIGTIHGMSVVVVILALFVFYWIIRKAVRDGMRDAWKRRSRETGRTEDDTHG
jgi:hypothetical protein